MWRVKIDIKVWCLYWLSKSASSFDKQNDSQNLTIESSVNSLIVYWWWFLTQVWQGRPRQKKKKLSTLFLAWVFSKKLFVNVKFRPCENVFGFSCWAWEGERSGFRFFAARCRLGRHAPVSDSHNVSLAYTGKSGDSNFGVGKNSPRRCCCVMFWIQYSFVDVRRETAFSLGSTFRINLRWLGHHAFLMQVESPKETIKGLFLPFWTSTSWIVAMSISSSWRRLDSSSTVVWIPFVLNCRMDSVLRSVPVLVLGWGGGGFLDGVWVWVGGGVLGGRVFLGGGGGWSSSGTMCLENFSLKESNASDINASVIHWHFVWLPPFDSQFHYQSLTVHLTVTVWSSPSCAVW